MLEVLSQTCQAAHSSVFMMIDILTLKYFHLIYGS